MRQFIQVPAIDFRTPYYLPTAAQNMIATSIIPRYNSGSWIGMGHAPRPRFPATLKLDAVIRLPDKCLIKDFECYAKDDFMFDATSKLILRRRNSFNGSSEGIAGYAILGQGLRGHRRIPGAITKPEICKINLERYFYYFELVIVLTGRPTWFSPQFRGARVSYEI